MTSTKQHYHFIGIGGIGMGTLAFLLLHQGHHITGSDLKENFLTKQLTLKGADIIIGHRPENISSPDCVVYSSAIPADNPELQTAFLKNIPVRKRAEVLARLMDLKKGVAVVGAHGKTTTASMIAHLLKTAGFSPTVAIGGVANNGYYTADTGSGDFFVAELDESDGSFLYFSNLYNIITNIDLEHVDFYSSWEKILNAYRDYICQIPQDGCVIGCGDDEKIQKLFLQTDSKKITYGLGGFNDVWASSIKTQGFHSRFDCWEKGKKLGSICLSIPGEHNVINALAAVALGGELNIDFDIIKESLSTYQGVQRRFTTRFHKNNILVIEDYGHHPKEISVALKTAKSLGYRRLISIFQPHRYTRTKRFLQEFADCFSLCDYFILTDIYGAGENPLPGLRIEQMIDRLLENKTISAEYLPMGNIVSRLLKLIQPGDLVIVFGAGDINQIFNELIKKLNLWARK